jgi:hypothetical protein
VPRIIYHPSPKADCSTDRRCNRGDELVSVELDLCLLSQNAELFFSFDMQVAKRGGILFFFSFFEFFF